MTVNERELFIAALPSDDHGQRAAYVNQACGNDGVLHKRILPLLQDYLEAGSRIGAQPTPTAAKNRRAGRLGPPRTNPEYELFQKPCFRKR